MKDKRGHGSNTRGKSRVWDSPKEYHEFKTGAKRRTQETARFVKNLKPSKKKNYNG